MWHVQLTSKISGAVLTAVRPRYEGSITVDAAILSAAGIAPFEQVHVLNLNSGARFETYAITGRRGVVELNGPASRLGMPGDELTILAYGLAPAGEAAHPRIVTLRGRNRIARIRSP